jgi:5'-nucleotidase
VLATSEVRLDGRRSSVRRVETNEGNLTADSLLWQANLSGAALGLPAAQIGLQNGGGIRNDSVIPAGNVTELNTFQILPFSNFVTVLAGVPRSEIEAVLENAVSRVEFADGRFAQVAGMRFTYDISLPAGSRVREATLDDGTPLIAAGDVIAGPALNVATIDFLARQGDQYPFTTPFTNVGVSYQQALANYLADGLGGQITATDYPEGGEGRITCIKSVAASPLSCPTAAPLPP